MLDEISQVLEKDDKSGSFVKVKVHPMESACRDGAAPGFFSPGKGSGWRGAQSQPCPLLL